MDLKIELQPKEKYIHVSVFGTFELQNAKDLFEKAFNNAIDQQFESMLVDCREMIGQATILQDYQYAQFISDFQIESRIKIEPPS